MTVATIKLDRFITVPSLGLEVRVSHRSPRIEKRPSCGIHHPLSALDQNNVFPETFIFEDSAT
jgi:hypothetical protein